MGCDLQQSELSKFRERLEQIRSHLFASLKDSAKDVKGGVQSKGYSQHQADAGADDFDRTISLGISSQDLIVLRQVERAIEKLDEGTYGVCDVTSLSIPLARLEAIPYATMTVTAQENLEKGKK